MTAHATASDAQTGHFMIADTTSVLTIADLQRIVGEVEPAALLVPPRILRRVIKLDRRLLGPGLQVPHRKSYLIDRDTLLRLADRDELGLGPPRRALPATVLLLPLADPARLQSRPVAETLLRYWRLLFHSHVHLAVARRRAEGKLGDEALRERMTCIGPIELDEIRAVLEQDHFLLPPGDAAAVYEEFAARYLELRAFARPRLVICFPGIDDFAAVDRLLAEDVNADAILAATRLPGAADPNLVELREADEEVPEPPEPEAIPLALDTESRRRLMAQADAAAGRGNRVRAAVLRQRAAALDVAHGEIEQLLTRLRQALQLPDGELDAWRGSLRALLEPAAAHRWPVERRVLYDLQKVCIDQEHDIYAVDLIEWIVSWGRRPIKRLLPHQSLVQTVKHLRRALYRLSGVRIAEPLRLQLVARMTVALHRSERLLRERFRPLIQKALDRVGLRPENYAERVGRDKLIEELLDRVVERQFLGMGELRDAIARNQLKLPDLGGPGEFFLGDRLIQANRQFVDDLDGVYRRGEIYLRWLQRLSSAAFGTAVGRFLTLYLLLPFGGAYLTLEAVHHVVELFHTHDASDLDFDGEEAAPLQLVNPYSVVGLGLFLFALLHIGWFRRGVTHSLLQAWHAARTALYDWPAALVRQAWVQWVLRSTWFVYVCQLLLKPLLWTAGVMLGCRLVGAGWLVAAPAGAAVFLAAAVLYNSRLGLVLEENLTDGVVRGWALLRRDVAPGLYRLVMGLFKRLLSDVERVLYAVDELLRFRAGDSRFALVWKPALGLAWFGVTYLVRLFINLFVEPTFNPIKHFPVVTVTAKLIVPIIPTLTTLISEPLAPMLGTPLALGAAGVAIFFLPGLAGFLVWELKENWRLYRTNRPATLQPVVIGSHGETIARFLRPGLHSGTVPKLYARLRRKRGTAAHKQAEALHHVGESLRHFVERDLLAVLAGSKRWAGTPIEAGDIPLSTNRIRFELRCPMLGGDKVCIDFALREGSLGAGIMPGDWLGKLQPVQAAALHDALAGFYKLAGVEQMEGTRFAEVPVTWSAWVETWERDQGGKGAEAARMLLPMVQFMIGVGNGNAGVLQLANGAGDVSR
jgi:hypothetical protein